MKKSILVFYVTKGDVLHHESVREFESNRSCFEWFRFNSNNLDSFRIEVYFDGELINETKLFRFRSLSRAKSIVSATVRNARIVYVNSIYIV